MQKYAALRTLATIQRVIAIAFVLFGVVGLTFTFITPRNPIFGAGIGTLWLVVALIAAFSLWCYTDLLYVFMDIEANTRSATDILAEQHQHLVQALPRTKTPEVEGKKGLTTLGLT
jgi:uncharacterized membrane protein YccC